MGTRCTKLVLRSFLGAALLVLSGCAGVVMTGGAPHRHAFDVPPGHLPPPGQCRIWYPDLPPGQQPPPGDCHDLQYRVPAEAYLIDNR